MRDGRLPRSSADVCFTHVAVVNLPPDTARGGATHRAAVAGASLQHWESGPQPSLALYRFARLIHSCHAACHSGVEGGSITFDVG